MSRLCIYWSPKLLNRKRKKRLATNLDATGKRLEAQNKRSEEQVATVLAALEKHKTLLKQFHLETEKQFDEASAQRVQLSESTTQKID